MKKNFALSFIFLFAFFIASPQKSPEKFGDNIDADFKIESCPIDSSAGAYVVFDFGVVTFDYQPSEGFTWTQNRHLRMKILNKNELDQASFSLSIYDHNGTRESIYGLKGCTYNLKDGKISESKITQKDIIFEETNEYWKRAKFALPNIEEGSVFEITYKLKSPYPTYLRDWYFQWDIPVLHSEIVLSIPEYFEYQQNMKGYHSLTTAKVFNETGRISLLESGSNPKYAMSESTVIDFITTTKHYVANNLPGIEEENFVDNMNNYRSGIEFELVRTKVGNNVTDYTTNWEAVEKKLMESAYYGEKIDKIGFADDKVKELIANYPDKNELLCAIYSYVQKKIKWDERTGFSSTESLKEVHDRGSGRSTDINFILLNMLREAGFDAQPVAISTRSNGIILPAFPTMEGFNNLVVLVRLEDKTILMDASTAYCPPGVLPVRDLNGQGRVINKGESYWVDLDPSEKHDEMVMYNLKISESGDFSGKITSMCKGYAAISLREKYEESLSEEKIIEDTEEENVGLKILMHEFTGFEEPFGQIKMDYEVEITGQTDFMGERLSFNPLLYERIESNPFKPEERKFPVNFSYPRNYMQIFKYELPEGYEVESSPEPINLANEDKSARFLFSTSKVGNLYSITVILQINKALFLPQEYAQLKDFYNHMIAKNAEPIIIKKTADL